jgi:hypothetical protein
VNYVTVGVHQKCVELVSGTFRLAVTTQVGPRIIGGFIDDSANIFAVLPPEPYKAAETGWMLYGGHRLWHAPEVLPRTYAPDNTPVTVAEDAKGVSFSSGVEAATGIEKTLRVRPLGRNRFELMHQLTNRNSWAVSLAPWALSVMATGGVAILPHARQAKGNPFAVDRVINLWPYSEFTDHRLTLGREFVMLRQDLQGIQPIKLGINSRAGWIAYVNQGTALVKHVPYDARVTYPDNGSNLEAYSCELFLEIETLGALVSLEPGQSATHFEVWHGLSGLGPINREDDIKSELTSRL